MPCQSQSSLYASEKRWSLAVADCWRRNCFLCCLWYLYFITISNILECQLPVIKLLFCFSYPLILKYRSWIDLWLRNTAGSSDSCVEWMRMHAIFWFMLLLFVFFLFLRTISAVYLLICMGLPFSLANSERTLLCLPLEVLGSATWCFQVAVHFLTVINSLPDFLHRH